MLDNIWIEVGDESLKASPAVELLADGLAAKWRGDYRQALQIYRDALAYAQQNNQELFVVIANMNMGNIFREWRSFDLAWVHYANAGKASSSLSSNRLKSDIANAMAGLAFENNDVATAFEGYSEAIEYAEKAGDKARIATLKHNIASVLQLQKEPHLAIPRYKEAFEIGIGHRSSHDQARTKCQIGVCWLETGIAIYAKEALTEARELALSSYRVDVLGDIEHNLGLAHLRLKETDQALITLRRAAGLRLHIADQATTRLSRIYARSKVLPTISLLIGVLFNLGNWLEALIWSELIRAREIIQFSRNSPLQRKDAELLLLQRQRSRNLVDLSVDGSVPDNELAENYNSTLINLLQLEESYERLVNTPELTSLTSFGKYLEEHTLKTNDTIYIFLPLLLEDMENGLGLLVVANGTVIQKKLIPIDWNPTEDFCEILADPYLQCDEASFVSLIDDMVEWLDKYDIFGESYHPNTGNPHKMVIIPWGNLHNMPLELKTISGRPAGLEIPIVRWFSVNQMREVTHRQRRERFAEKSKPWSALGTTVLHILSRSKLPRTPAADSLRALVIADPTNDLNIGLLDYELEMENGGLTGALEEGTIVADFLENHGWQVDRLFHSQVTSTTVIDLLNQQPYTLIHYAGHSLFDPDYPERSALLIRDANELKAYPLTAEELLLKVQLSAQPLIVLSGCRTGSVAMRSGGEPDGLTQALFACGASALMTTGWPILDANTTEFMENLYEALCQGKTLDGAAMAARRSCSKVYLDIASDVLDEATRKWAAFRIYGLGGQTFT